MLKKPAVTLWSRPTALALGLALSPIAACEIVADDGVDPDGAPDLSNIEEDLTLEGDVTALGSIIVRNGATLTIAPGTTIRLRSNEGLIVEDGALIANGTDDDGITIRGVDDGAGRFLGVRLGAGTLSGTSLAFVRVDGGGQDGFGHKAAIQLDGVPAGRVSLADVVVANAAQAGIFLEGSEASLAAFDRVAIDGAPKGIVASPIQLGAIDEAVATTEVTTHEILAGEVATSVTWTGQALPFVVDGDIEVGDTLNPVLTLGAGLTLRFGTDRWLRVGGNEAGGLVAVGTAEAPVVLTSLNATPARGDWLGLHFGSNTLANSRLTFTTVEAAGKDAFGQKGCVHLDSGIGATRLTLENVTLKDCDQAALAMLSDTPALAAVDGLGIVNSTRGVRSTLQNLDALTESLSYTTTTVNAIIADRIDSDVTLVAQSVPWIVEGSIEIEGGATFTVAGGSELRFERDQWLRALDGRVVLDGTAAAGVVVGAADTAAAAGAWLGLFFDAETLSGTALRHTLVKQGGQDAFGAKGGITILGDTNSAVTLDTVTFATNAQADVFTTCGATPTLTNTTVTVVNDC